MTPSQRQEDALGSLTTLLRKSSRAPNARELERGLEALLQRVADPSEARRQARRRWLAGGFAVAIAGVSILLVLGRASTPAEPLVALSRIEGGSLLEGGYLSESGDGGVRLFFNEGSEFVLTPGARGRLRSVGAQGTQFSIERGSASFRITPAKERRWSVEAGPFSVSVHGTEFTVQWDPTTEKFELALRRGRVLVSGPMVGNDLGLKPGQKLSVSLPRAETIITEERPGQPAAAPSAPSAESAREAPPASPSEATPEALPPDATPARAPRSSASEARASGGRRWKEAMANGQWDQILADVRRDGVQATVAAVSSEELFALADAARYRRRPDLARAALLAHRERFPGSARSLETLFLLGRVEESRSSGARKAIEWYDAYLARSPSGTYSSEALGRKMLLSKQVHGAAFARAIAKDYLERFPEGTYAGTARALLGRTP